MSSGTAGETKMVAPLPVPVCYRRYPVLLLRTRDHGRDSRRPPVPCRDSDRDMGSAIRERTDRYTSARLPDPAAQRSADVLYFHSGAVCVEGLYGEQETADLYRQKERRIYKYLNSEFLGVGKCPPGGMYC